MRGEGGPWFIAERIARAQARVGMGSELKPRRE